jgi:hypothetical protein
MSNQPPHVLTAREIAEMYGNIGREAELEIAILRYVEWHLTQSMEAEFARSETSRDADTEERAMVTINGRYYLIGDKMLTHERICGFAGRPVHATVAYRSPRNGDLQRSGITCIGDVIEIENGMTIDCAVTGNV